MKNGLVWNILTVVMVLGIACLSCGVLMIVLNPQSSFNPLQEPATYTPVALADFPTSTTVGGGRTLPPTWTPIATDLPAEVVATITLAPSSTLMPTNTLFVLPSATVTLTPTKTPRPTALNTRCIISLEDPLDNAEFAPNESFTKLWRLVNTSGDAWKAENSDFRQVSGDPMQTGAGIYDLNSDVADGGSVDFAVRMRAPAAPGTYVSNWALTMDGQDMCKFFAKIVVK